MWDLIRIKPLLVAEGHRFEREDRLASVVHGLDLVFEDQSKNVIGKCQLVALVGQPQRIELSQLQRLIQGCVEEQRACMLHDAFLRRGAVGQQVIGDLLNGRSAGLVFVAQFVGAQFL